jgi:hypothetical protein
MKKLLYLCIILPIVSCVSRSHQEIGVDDSLGLPYYVSLETPLKNRVPVDLSEIGGSITYIPLETSQNTLVGRVSKIIVTDSLIFISTIPYKLMAFDYSGRFVRNYGNVGRGPGEFIHISDFAVSFDRSRVYIMTTGGIRLAYDMSADFLHATKVNASHFIPYNDTLFVYHLDNRRPMADQSRLPGAPVGVSVFFSDLQGNMRESYMYRHLVESPTIVFLPILYHSENSVRFFERLVDSLYTVTPEALIPYAAFDLGSERVPLDFYLTPSSTTVELFAKMESYAHKFDLQAVLEDREHLYIKFVSGSEDRRRYDYGFFNKQTGAVKITEKGGFTNDLDGGVPFFPKYVYNDEVLVDYVDAYVLKEHVASLDPAEMTRLYGDNYTRLAALAESLEEDSNPVMILVK